MDGGEVTRIDPRGIGARIRMQLPLLTLLEARVVETITRRADLTDATALHDIAADAGVSDAMVVKIAKKLGFAGFRELRAALVSYNRLDVADLHREISPDDSAADIVQKVFRTSVQAIEETLAILDVGTFERAADALARARHRDFYGIGGSAQIARDVAHKFLRIGLRVAVHDDAHMMLMSAAMLGPDDAVVAFSHSGETTAVIDALALARRSGARCVAVSNYVGSTLARGADLTLCSTAQGSPLLGENAAARIAQLNIMDALFVAVAGRDLAAAEANLARTRRAVAPRRGRPGDAAWPG